MPHPAVRKQPAPVEARLKPRMENIGRAIDGTRRQAVSVEILDIEDVEPARAMRERGLPGRKLEERHRIQIIVCVVIAAVYLPDDIYGQGMKVAALPLPIVFEQTPFRSGRLEAHAPGAKSHRGVETVGRTDI